MSGIGHNGGPSPDADSKMRWVRINISDLLEGIEGLTWEQRGFYITMLFKMYARQGGLPADDREGARALGCNPRTFRMHRDQLLSQGKIYVDDGTLRNGRVEREIADFCREVKRRRDAALEREQRRRDAAASHEVQPEFEANSTPIRGEFDLNSTPSKTEFEANVREFSNENNVCTATALVQTDHSSGGNQKPETRNQKVSEESEEKEGGADAPAAGAALLVPIDPGALTPVEVDALEAFNLWNDLAVRIGLPVARSLTPQRRRGIVARMREHGGPNAWRQALANVERSAFLQGQNDRRWRADLDFLLQASRFAKVVDGAYGNGAYARAAREGSTARTMRLAREAAERMGYSEGRS